MTKKEQNTESQSTDLPAKRLLQKTMDDLYSRLEGHPSSSFAIRCVRAHRAGVPQESIDKAFSVIEQSVANARAAYHKALEAPAKKAPGPVQSGVQL